MRASLPMPVRPRRLAGTSLRAVAALAASLALAATAPLGAQRPAYPATPTVPHVDTYHGVAVPDPYRWLEDDTASATRQWVRDQNAVTFGFLGRIPFRDSLKARLMRLQDYPREGLPIVRGPWRFVSRNTGLQNQGVWYVQRGADGPVRVHLDPNAEDPAGTTRFGAPVINRAATLAAHTVNRAGSDWQEIQVREIATGRVLPDRLRWVKVSGIAWWGDGFFYSRYPAPADTTRALTAKNEDHRVYYHRLGTPQDADVPTWADPANPQRFHLVATTPDERFAVLSISDRGRGKDGNALWVRDLSASDTGWRPIVTGFDDRFEVVANVGRRLVVRTNRGAPRERVVGIPVDDPAEARWTPLIPERDQPLEFVARAGDRLFAGYLVDATTRVREHGLDGAFRREVALPGLGTVGGFGGEPEARETFFSFASFTAPPTVFRYDLASGRREVVSRPRLPFDPSQFETRQAFATSKDGTRVPLFIVARKGLRRDGRNPTLVYGYGGFNISLLPSFSATRMAWLEQGGIYVQVTLRGGGEYGDPWHLAGTKARKQNVFDDFIAAAEWLVANGYTAPDRLAMQGGSNGGLLVGAVMTQRPDLFRVALPAVGVMDMLRFHRFTIGWNWIADYGSSDDPEGFRYLRAYSPLHNLKPGTTYPATLVTTADHDDRVVPGHSFKFAATLQASQVGDRPVLIRVETQSGHGASSTTKAIEETADILAFTMQQLGMTPAFGPRTVP